MRGIFQLNQWSGGSKQQSVNSDGTVYCSLKMLITHTELIDLLRKVFEGLGYGLGEDDDCAKAVAWLAMRDRPILQQLANDPAAFAPALRVPILDETVKFVVVDGSLGNVMGVVSELMRYKVGESADTVKAIIQDAPVPELIVPYMTQLGGETSWSDGQEAHVVKNVSWTIKPSTAILPLTIFCKPDDAPFDLFANRYQNHLENGLPIEDHIWDKLKLLAQAILVPESEYSRQHGAG